MDLGGTRIARRRRERERLKRHGDDRWVVDPSERGRRGRQLARRLVDRLPGAAGADVAPDGRRPTPQSMPTRGRTDDEELQQRIVLLLGLSSCDALALRVLTAL